MYLTDMTEKNETQKSNCCMIPFISVQKQENDGNNSSTSFGTVMTGRKQRHSGGGNNVLYLGLDSGAIL